MSIKYRTIQRKVLNGPEEGKIKTYAIARSTYNCDINRLCDLVSARTKMWNTEVKSVVEALLWVMRMEVANGAIVQLPPFGSFRYVIQSEGVADGEDFKSHHIKGAKLIFHPSVQIRNIARDVKFELAQVIEKEVDNSEPCPFPH